jgi:hypothetical protein
VHIAQESTDEVLDKLEITGTADELRRFALLLLDAIDNGKAKAKIRAKRHRTKLTLRCRE